jgi:hypothetical protein
MVTRTFKLMLRFLCILKDSLRLASVNRIGFELFQVSRALQRFASSDLERQ